MNLENFYQKIFCPVFLVEYGYYDYNIKNKELYNENQDEFYGQSPTLFYKIFNMNDIADELLRFQKFDFTNEELCFDEFRNEYFLNDFEKITFTDPIYFSTPKVDDARRQYKFPNIYNYLAIALYICDYRREFIDEFNKNNNSTSKYFNQMEMKYKETKKIEQKNLFYGKYRLKLDLSNFYHSLYTHSIPWAIMGKDEAKKEKKKGFSNGLDKLIQKSQFNETFGIPVGNLISRIVAELFMCHIDEEISNEYIYSRYVDDITFPYNYEADKIRFYQLFQSICDKYNLKINDKKTEVEKFPFKNNNDKTQIFSYFDDFNANSNIKWIDKISNFIDFCIHEESVGNKGAVKCIFASIFFALDNSNKTKKIINKIFLSKDPLSEFNIFEKILDVSFFDSCLSNKFIEFTENIIKLGVKKEDLDLIVNDYFKRNRNLKNQTNEYIENNKNQELYQVLLYCVIFNVNTLFTQEEILKILSKELDDFSIILTIILSLKMKDRIHINNVIEEIDKLLEKNHRKYGEEFNRFRESLWLVRYFMYSLIRDELIDINSYFKECEINKDNSGNYISELDWNYISKKTKENVVTKFYDKLLTNNVKLVHYGKNKNFIY